MKLLGKAKAFERLFREFGLDNPAHQRPLTPEEELEQRRSELKNGLTDKQRLFLFGKLSGLNEQRCGDSSWVFNERGREHQTENLEAEDPDGV